LTIACVLIIIVKLISLNIWRGKMRQPLLDFLEKYKDEVDVFCFQEIPGAETEDGKALLTYSQIKDLLGNFTNYSKDYFATKHGFRDDLGIFVRKDIEVDISGEIQLHDPSIGSDNIEQNWRDLGYVFINVNGKKYLIANFHGLWDGPGKSDDPRRLEQSRKVKNFLDQHDITKILAGDFNLWPGTESLKILEKDMVNLIDKYNFHSTRPPFFDFPNKYSDYVFVSPDIKINDFKVLSDVVSDHLALYLDYE